MELKFNNGVINMDFENLYANRIGGSNFGKDTTIYKFEKIKELKQKQ